MNSNLNTDKLKFKMITEHSPIIPVSSKWSFLYTYQAQLIHSIIVGETAHSVQMLTEKMGTGKTLVILGLILVQRQPQRNNPPLYYFNPEFETYPKMQNGNIIVCPPSIIGHWVTHIEKFTSLSYYVISARKHVEEMTHLNYDIILISSGKAKNRDPHSNDRNIKLQIINRKIISYVMLFWAKWEGMVFDRVIYDEFHTMDIGYAVLGKSVILVSSTPKIKSPKFAPYSIYVTIQQLIEYFKPPHVKCHPDYMAQIDYTPKMKIFTYLFKNNKLEKKLLSFIDDSEVHEAYLADRLLYDGKMHEFLINLMLYPYQKRKLLRQQGKDTTSVDNEIARQREAIFTEECPVCCLEMTPIIRIYQCCGCTICKDCSIESKCPQCANVGSKTYDLDYDKIQELKNDPIENRFKIVSKIDIIHDIIRGNPINSVPIYESNKLSSAILQNGHMYIEPPKRLIAILSNYNKIHDKIMEGLNIKCMKLTAKNAIEISNVRPADEPQIILVNTKQISAGINLPWVTDVIITHAYNNEQSFTQILGRFQRINREYSVRIHQIKFE